jgi:hypothetical protein
MAIVYQHRRNDNNNVFYVGIGLSKYRATQKSKTARNDHWHRIVAKHGYTIEITHKDVCWEEAQSIEKYLISFWRGYLGKESLANQTDGGDGTFGYKMSKETRNKISKRAIGRKYTKETIEKRTAKFKETVSKPEIRQKYKTSRIGAKNGRSKSVIDIVTGETFECVKYSAKSIGMPVSTLQGWLNNRNENKTNFRYNV